MSIDRQRARERGQVVVMFALLIPVMFALAAVVLDVGNWYVHKRHLQTQVDAAALAADGELIGCFLDQPTANQDVRAEALKYAGDTGRVPTPADTTNLQVQEPNDVRVVLNGSAYWTMAIPIPTYPPDPGPTADPYGHDWTLDGDPSRSRCPIVSAMRFEVPRCEGNGCRRTTALGTPPLDTKSQGAGEGGNPKGALNDGDAPVRRSGAQPHNRCRPCGSIERRRTRLTPGHSSPPPTPNTTELKNGKSVALWRAAPGPLTVVDQTGMIVLSSRRVLTDTDLQGKTLTEMCAIPTTFCFSGTTNGSQRRLHTWHSARRRTPSWLHPARSSRVSRRRLAWHPATTTRSRAARRTRTPPRTSSRNADCDIDLRAAGRVRQPRKPARRSREWSPVRQQLQRRSADGTEGRMVGDHLGYRLSTRTAPGLRATTSVGKPAMAAAHSRATSVSR